MDLSSKVVLVVGGGRGLGRAIGEQFARGGATVVIAEDDTLAGALVAEELSAVGEVHFLDADVSSEPSVKAMLERVETAHGPVNYVVFCSCARHTGSVEQLTAAEWQRTVDHNLKGAFFFGKHAPRHMSAQGGAIVNVAVDVGLSVDDASAACLASRLGLLGLTYSLSRSVAPAIRVYCVGPAEVALAGAADTDDVLTEASAAQAVLRLCSGDHKIASGQGIALRQGV